MAAVRMYVVTQKFETKVRAESPSDAVSKVVEATVVDCDEGVTKPISINSREDY